MSRSQYKNGKTKDLSGVQPDKSSTPYISINSSSVRLDDNVFKSLVGSLADNDQSEVALLSDLEKRLEQRLASVDAKVSRKTGKVDRRKPVSDEADEEDTPLTYEVTEALDFNAIGLGRKQNEVSSDKSDSDNPFPVEIAPPVKVDPVVNASPADIAAITLDGEMDHDTVRPPTLNWQNGKSDTALFSDDAGDNNQKEITAALALLSELGRLSENMDRPAVVSDAVASVSATPGGFEQSHDPFVPPAHVGETLEDLASTPNHGMTTGSELVPDQKPGSQQVMPLDMDNDPPPLSPHLNRKERLPDGKRSLVIAGFLGGLLIAFVSVWGYFYTLPKDQQNISGVKSNQFSTPALYRGKLTFKTEDVAWNTGKALSVGMSITGNQPERGILVKLEGLPSDARLSQGFPSGNGDWIIPSSQLDDLTLSLKAMPQGAITVRARLLEKDAKTDTGNFASFSIYPEHAVPVDPRNASGFVAANTGMPSIPIPEFVDGHLDNGQVGMTVPSGAHGTAYPGSLNQYKSGLSQADGFSGAVEADGDEDEALGVLPGDFSGNSASTNGADSAVQHAARSALAQPPARAKSTNAQRRPGVGRQAMLQARPGVGAGFIGRNTTRNAITSVQRGLVSDGNRLMRSGDIRGARALYEQAMAGKSPEAAMALGRSYDPNYLGRIVNANASADTQRALDLYSQALAGGLDAVRIKIDRLIKFMGKG